MGDQIKNQSRSSTSLFTARSYWDMSAVSHHFVKELGCVLLKVIAMFTRKYQGYFQFLILIIYPDDIRYYLYAEIRSTDTHSSYNSFSVPVFYREVL